MGELEDNSVETQFGILQRIWNTSVPKSSFAS